MRQDAGIRQNPYSDRYRCPAGGQSV